MIEKLDVILWDMKAGTLISSKNGYNRQICFYFDSDFIKSGYNIAPLQAPLTGIIAQKGLPVYPERDKLFGGLPSFIADSLPDQWGNIIFTEWAKAHNIRSRDMSPLDRLAYIGRRGMGALEFIPPAAEGLEKPFKVEISQLSELAQIALNEAKGFHTLLTPDFIVESLFKVGTSAGGRRPKAVININTESGECYSGQVTTPYEGFIPMIIKFDEHRDCPTTNIEYSYYLMACEAGLKMTPCHLIKGNKEIHFLTQRFDRKDNRKIHVQTLVALAPNATTYEDLFDVAFKIDISVKEIQHLFRQMVMNVLGGNVDDHNKNFSFIMDKDGIWHSAPAYDYTFTVDPSAPFYVNRHSMSINGRTQDITYSDLFKFARKYSIKNVDSIITQACSAVTNYRKYALEAGVNESWISIIEQEISSRLKALDMALR
ncbi:MAG: type II toxin-antitoxin system HipA family toxin [Muribaculaceae bacterium]|nr:type II toxin-antitoxin system HipA family toxin [Muribaculaceae bacterium]